MILRLAVVCGQTELFGAVIMVQDFLERRKVVEVRMVVRKIIFEVVYGLIGDKIQWKLVVKSHIVNSTAR